MNCNTLRLVIRLTRSSKLGYGRNRESAMETGGRTVQNVLLVDDDESVLKTWARQCKRIGKVPLAAMNLKDALDIAERHKPEMAVVDLHMPNCSGLIMIRAVKQVADIFAILVSGLMCTEYAMQGVQAGADDCYDKWVTIAQLVHRVESGRRPDPTSIEIPTLQEVEQQYVLRVLNDCGGNTTHAAEALGEHRYTLQRKLKKWGVLRLARVRRPGCGS